MPEPETPEPKDQMPEIQIEKVDEVEVEVEDN